MPTTRLTDMTSADLNLIRQNFVSELRLARQGLESSLSYLATPQNFSLGIPSDHPFQVLTTGGSILESALVKYEFNTELSILHTSRTKLPVIQTVWDLMNVVEENLLNEVEVLAINFAYPIQPVLRQGRLDGKLLRPVKEHLFAGLVGKCVGQQIEEYFGGKGRHLKVTLANDMVCLLQAGREKVNDSRTLVAGVVGTGVNFAILDAEYGIVNLESAGFDKFKISWAGRAIDQVSKNVGQHLFEKEVSGKYLFEHYNLMKNVFQLEPIETSEQLNQIADETKHPGRNLARSILMRSAELLACQIAGLLDFLGQNKLTFVMEGSLFWKGWHYQGLIYSALKKMDISADRVEFVEIKQSNILGAGRLVKLI